MSDDIDALLDTARQAALEWRAAHEMEREAGEKLRDARINLRRAQVRERMKKLRGLWTKNGSLEACPESPGVYAVFEFGGLLVYVGESNNMRERLSQHQREWLDDHHRIRTRPERFPFERKTLEARLIARLRPLRNKVHTK